MIQKKPTTLVLLYNDQQILLGMKKRGFATGKWNGYGGKLADGETPEQGALRELEEESGIKLNNLEKRGVFTFIYEEVGETWQTHVFAVPGFTGNAIETEEMRPQWFNHKDIPFADMWADDKFWMPLLLAGKKFKGTFRFKDYKTILSYDLAEAEEV